MAYRRAAGLMVGVLATLGPASLPASAEPISLDAIFEHKASIPYRTALFGRVTLGLDTSAGGVAVAFRLGLGEETCRLAMMWGPAEQAAPNASLSPTAPMDACLTGDHIDEATLNAWRHGQGSVDPAAGLLFTSGGLGTVTDGEVSNNPIGVHIGATPIDISCVLSRVVYVDNERVFDGLRLPAPDATPPDPDAPPPPPPVCAGVPFVCDWCVPE